MAEQANRRQSLSELLNAAAECRNVLRDLLSGEEKRRREAPEQKIQAPGDFVGDLMAQSKSLRSRLIKAVSGMQEGEMLGKCCHLAVRMLGFYR